MRKTKFWNLQKRADGTGELMLYGDISTSTWWGDEITPKQFKADLEDLGDVQQLDIYINSGGGDVFAGQAIHSMLKRHAAHKTVFIDGLAASIASVVAMAGDRIIMPKNAMIMIHNAWTIAAGSKEDFRKMADDMEKVDESIRTTYVDRTGLGENEIIALMDAETWFTAEEAVAKGFADEIEREKVLAASKDGTFLTVNQVQVDLDRYKNIPEIEASQEEPQAENEGESQLVSDIFQTLRKKIHTYEEDAE